MGLTIILYTVDELTRHEVLRKIYYPVTRVLIASRDGMQYIAASKHNARGATMTKTEALHALRLYMHDARAEARQEGFKIDRTEVWSQMVAGWREIGDISNETAAAWIASGPR